MPLLKEEITEEFIENMVDRVIDRLGDKFEDLDISLDYIAAILSGHSGAALGVQHAALGRFTRPRRPVLAPSEDA